MKRSIAVILFLILNLSLTAQNSDYSVGRLNTVFQVGSFGDAEFSMPVELPENIGSLTQISLNYSSLNGYGYLGYGFEIGGLSVIERTNKNLFFDGVSSAINFAKGSDFLLDGKRFIKISENKYSLEGDLTAEINYYDNGKYFEVKKDGKNFIYTTDIFRLDGTASWHLSQVSDNYGNVTKYSYAGGRLTRININNVYNVDFEYDFYENHIYYSRFGKQIEITTCLSKVCVKKGYKNVFTYNIEYSEQNNRRYITKITKQNAKGELLPPVKFSWSIANGYIEERTLDIKNYSASTNSKEIDFYEQQIISGDFNGDGLDDIVLISPQRISDNAVLFKNKVIFYEAKKKDLNVVFDYVNSFFIDGDIYMDEITKKNIFGFIDYDGDGKNEFVMPMFQNTADGKIKQVDFKMVDCYGNGNAVALNVNCDDMPKIVYADFKNNGKTQILYVETKKINGKYFAKLLSDKENVKMMELILPDTPKEIFASDFNGDNAVDIIIFYKKGYCIFYNDGQGNFINSRKKERTNVMDGFFIIRSGDFNGDGLVDFVYTETDDKNWYFLLNKGDNEDFSKTIALTSDFYDRGYTDRDNGKFDLHVLDFNCDGKTDVIVTRAQYDKKTDMWSKPWGEYDKTQICWLTSNGKGFTIANTTPSNEPKHALNSVFCIGDFNGDGVYEFMNYGYNCRSIRQQTVSPKWHIYENTQIRPNANKITSISDCYGTTKINYSVLTDKNVYEKGINQKYPMRDILCPMPVVSSTETCNGLTNNVVKKYKYFSLTANLQGRGLLGFDKTVCSNEYNGEVLISEINDWNTEFYSPKKITQTVTRDTSMTKAETEFMITGKGGKNFFVYPSKIINTDIYGDTTINENVYNTNDGYLESTKTEYKGGFYKLQKFEDYVNAGGVWLPQSVINEQKIPQDDKPFVTKKYNEYDVNTGLPIKQIDNFGTENQFFTEYQYNQNGDVIHSETYGANTEKYLTDFEYDGRNLISVSKNFPKSVIKYSYDEFDNLVSQIENGNLKTVFEYDGWKNLVMTKNPDSTISTVSKGWGTDKVKFYYELEQQTAAPWTKTWYDVLGRKTLVETVAEGNSDVKNYSFYDKFSNLTSTKTLIDGKEYIESFLYDDLNRIIEKTDKNGNVTKYSYTKNSVETDFNGKKTLKKFDVFNNLLSVKDEVSTINYTYNSACKPIRIIAAGAEYAFEYDDAGNRTMLSDPDGGKYTYEYGCFQNIIKQTDAEGNITENFYDKGLLVKSVCGSELFLYDYDEYGNLVKTQCGDVLTEYSYDTLNRLKSEIYTIDNKKYCYNFTYNKCGLLDSKTFPDNTVERYKYDVLGNVNEVLLNDATVWKLKSCSPTNRTAEILGKYLKSLDFDKYGFLVSTDLSFDDKPLKTMTYDFDIKTGNLIGRNGMFSETETFEYDNADRLTKLIRGQNIVETDYAENGNILFKTGLGSYEYFKKRPHALESVENTDTLIKNPRQEITYTPFNKVKNLTQYFDDESSTSISFTYDADKIRRKSVSKIDGKVITQYFLPDYEEVDGCGRHYINSPDGLIGIYFTDSTGKGGFQTAFTDHLGSITALYQDTVLSFSAEYDAFGKRTITTGTNDFSRGFCGVHLHYPMFDIIDMGGRMYDPIVGRFLSPDPYVQDWENSQNFNRYSYCLNNPLKYTDPTGEYWNLIVGGIIGGISNWMLNGCKFSWNGLGYFGVGALSGALSSGVGSGIGSLLGGGSFTAGFIGTGATATKCFITGAAIGGASGFTSGLVGGIGNSLVSGNGFSSSMKDGLVEGLIGGTTGGLTTGMFYGFAAKKNGIRFLDGATIQTNIYDMKLPFVSQQGDWNCLPACGESASLNSVSQQQIRLQLGGKANLDGVKLGIAWQKWGIMTGRANIQIYEGHNYHLTLNVDNIIKNITSAKPPVYALTYDLGNNVGHEVLLNKIVHKTITKISGYTFNKYAFYVMDPMQSQYSRYNFKTPINYVYMLFQK